MLSLVPWGRNGVSLDLMRRSPQSPNGTIELMVSELALHAERIGISRISLNFAMFRSAFEQGAQLGAGPVARLWRGFLLFFSRWWQLETLYRSNMKYQPDWVPRFACYEDARMIPRVGVASSIAEGFLVLPFARRDEQHTGHHPSVPPTLLATGLLHARRLGTGCVGAAGGRLRRRRRPRPPTARADARPAVQAEGAAGQRHRRLSGGAAAQSHGRPGARHRRPDDVSVSGRVLRIRDFGGVLFAAAARLVSRSSTAAGEFDSRARSYRRFHQGHRSRRPGRSDREDGIQQDRHPVADRAQLAADRQVPAPAAEQVERPDRPRSAGAQPLRRPGRQRRVARADHRPAARACGPFGIP